MGSSLENESSRFLLFRTQCVDSLKLLRLATNVSNPASFKLGCLGPHINNFTNKHSWSMSINKHKLLINLIVFSSLKFAINKQQTTTFGAEDPRGGARVTGLVVAGVALAVRVVVDLHTRRVRVEGLARFAVEALLTQFLS